MDQIPIPFFTGRIYCLQDIMEVYQLSKGNWSEEILQKIRSKTGRNVSRGSIQRIAKGVKSDTTRNEQEIRRLIQQVSKMAGVSVSEETTRQLIRTIKTQQITPANMMSLLRQFQKK